MRHASTILTVVTALGAMLAGSSQADDALGVPGVSDLIPNRLMVRTVDDASIDPFVAAYEANHPDTDLTQLDAIPGRPIYLLEILSPVPPNPDEVELDLSTNYAEFIVWGELLYENSAPEGHTGSTWVDSPVNASLYQEQYAVPLLGLEVGAANRPVRVWPWRCWTPASMRVIPRCREGFSPAGTTSSTTTVTRATPARASWSVTVPTSPASSP